MDRDRKVPSSWMVGLPLELKQFLLDEGELWVMDDQDGEVRLTIQDCCPDGLDAYGFGKKFRKWVGMMNDENNPPQRRMYVNGYYSEWFPIRSGVA
eukprot:4873509-Prymnesium_polylepis.2